MGCVSISGNKRVCERERSSVRIFSVAHTDTRVFVLSTILSLLLWKIILGSQSINTMLFPILLWIVCVCQVLIVLADCAMGFMWLICRLFNDTGASLQRLVVVFVELIGALTGGSWGGIGLAAVFIGIGIIYQLPLKKVIDV